MHVSDASAASCSAPERRSAGLRSTRQSPVSAPILSHRTETYDLLVIPKLEVVLYHPIFVPVICFGRIIDEPSGGRTHFLMWYLSRCPFFTLLKSHATTYSPVEVTIVFSSWFSPI